MKLAFWEQVAADLNNGLAGISAAGKWSVHGVEELRKDPSLIDRDDVCKVYLSQKEPKRTRTHLRVVVSQAWHRSGRMNYYGISFSDEQPLPHPLAEIEALRKALPESLGRTRQNVDRVYVDRY